MIIIISLMILSYLVVGQVLGSTKVYEPVTYISNLIMDTTNDIR